MSDRNLMHYTDTLVPWLTVSARTQKTSGTFRPKPEGFWISDEDGDPGWSQWCAENEYGLGTHGYRVRLATEARLLWLTTVAELVEFDREYRLEGPRSYLVDWPRVAEQWQGIFITPYQWPLRLSGVDWYYTWDCASGCVWDPSAIASVEHVRTLERVQ